MLVSAREIEAAGRPSAGWGELGADVLEHRSQVLGRAELQEDDALIRPSRVPGRPEVEITCPIGVFGAVGMADMDRSLDDISPVGALIPVVGKSLEQQGEVRTGREVDVAHE